MPMYIMPLEHALNERAIVNNCDGIETTTLGIISDIYVTPSVRSPSRGNCID
ncbi:protein of unknown function [Xenorhabdus bovienii]|uniref:Uncharacterized protein n=1 Tax=Xenorhabdus bovienii TaxID=40576 RepID=A0A0B6X934_XENBV|nr:protein of unknown function [Xenorhabdus bovienii]